MKKQKKSKVRRMVQARLREERKEAGAYDGRFSPRVQPDKKKQARKNACRKFNKDE